MRHFSRVFFLVTVFLHFGKAGNKGGVNNVLPVHVYAGDDALLPCVVPHQDGNSDQPRHLHFQDEELDDGVGGSVLWRRGAALLTAGERRVSADKRYGILHDSGGDVWVLVIRKATLEDAGLYVCETNVEPVTRSFHKLSVLSRTPSASPPAPPATGVHAEPSVSQVANHSGCCVARNVSFQCSPLCALSSEQLTASPRDLPQRCAVHVPDIVQCLTGQSSGAANGDRQQQQSKCCQLHRVPIGCASWCAGVRPAGDSLKARMSCAAHATTALACAAAAGAEAKPHVGRPRAVAAQAVSARALNVSWQPPEADYETGRQLPAEAFVVTARLLAAFDDDVIATTTANDTQEGNRRGSGIPMGGGDGRAHVEPEDVFADNSTHSVTVPGSSRSVILRDLHPFSMYEVHVTGRSARGADGESSDAVRALTLPPAAAPGTNAQPASASASPPDASRCCAKAGITDHDCLSRLCSGPGSVWVSGGDASACSDATAAAALPCLLKAAGGSNETTCCQARGVPPRCLPACALHTPSTLPLDFVYHKCSAHATDVWGCALRKRRQLPSAPRRLRAPLLRPTFALLRWTAPAARGDSVRAYALRWRPLPSAPLRDAATKHEQPHDALMDYKVERAEGAACLLERLLPGQRYEVFVQAVNAWGAGEASSRLIFATPSREWLEARADEALATAAGSVSNAANASASCCVAAGLPTACQPLCAFDVSVEAATAFAAPCTPHLHTLLRCGANGREHGPCCKRRGVPQACLRACAGVLEGTLAQVAKACAHFVGDILLCFEEGAGLLPGPVEQLSAERVTDDAVLLRWRPSSEAGAGAEAGVESGGGEGERDVERFVVHFQKENASASPPPLATALTHQVVVSQPTAEVRGLETRALYRFFVVAQNRHGSSLPSSVLMINVTHTAEVVAAVPSPPHSLAVAAHSATWLSVTWQPPLFSLPSQRLSYKLFHKAAAAGAWHEARTGVPALTLQNLVPNAQYIAYVVAQAEGQGQGSSLPSETLVAWTDPAYPAFVEPPTVHPASLVTEGGSMTVLCIAMGAPTPTISLYVAGRLLRQEETRHMVTVVHNVTRDMETVACYADNGYGTPMQAARKVAISYPPHVTAQNVTWASRGEDAALECRVRARPEPQMVFWRDAAGRVPVVQGGRFDISILPDSEEDWAFSMRLTVRRVTDEDAGQYICRADNALGDATQPVTLRVRARAVTSGHADLSACCEERNVSVACQDVCAFHLDLSGASARAECAGDLPALVRCAADGADHRDCCARRGVPELCLEWCAGRPLAGMERCARLHATAMADCFTVGGERLPGPPRHVRVDAIDTHSARVRWDPPLKNPAHAEMYRVFWREVEGGSSPASSSSSKGDTRALSLRVTGLRAGVRYEAAVKAGNRRGSGALSPPATFVTLLSDEVVSAAAEAAAAANSGSVWWRVGAAVASALALLVAAAAVGVWWLRRRRDLRAKSLGGGSGNHGGVAFENPSYLREMFAAERAQMSALMEMSTESPSVTTASDAADPPPPLPPLPPPPPPTAASPPHSVAGWVTETLHFPPSSPPSSPPSLPPRPVQVPSEGGEEHQERVSLGRSSVCFDFIE